MWRDRADFASGLQTIQLGKPDIQQNQVGLKLFSFLYGFESIGSFGDNLPILMAFEQLDNHATPGFAVVNQENTS
jgi:hypothetical protein